MTEEQGNWHDCVCDNAYEINDAFPYPIRRKGSDKIIKERADNSDSYIYCYLNAKKYKKHRIIALQFIENDNPDTKTIVDHIDRNKHNNNINNLRWVTSSENNKNKTSNLNVVYEYFDTINADAIEVNDYGSHQLEFYYYSEEDDAFYFYNGQQYRKLHVNIMKKTGVAFVQVYDTDGKRVSVCLNKFKQLYGIEF